MCRATYACNQNRWKATKSCLVTGLLSNGIMDTNLSYTNKIYRVAPYLRAAPHNSQFAEVPNNKRHNYEIQ
jgi:hypothetical protein